MLLTIEVHFLYCVTMLEMFLKYLQMSLGARALFLFQESTGSEENQNYLRLDFS